MAYKRFIWETIPFDTCQINTTGDGNCLFHAICNAFYKPYRTEMVNGQRMSRIEIVQNFRSELASTLGEVDPDDKNKRIRYETLGGGSLKELGDTGLRPEYTLKGLQSTLRSNVAMGDEIIPFIGEILHKSFYFLDTRTMDVYIPVSLPPEDNPAIVLLYNGYHYDLCAISESDGSITTYFSPNHPFILYIRNRIDDLKNQSV